MHRLLSVVGLTTGLAAAASLPGGYRLTDRIPLPGENSWSSVAIDEIGRRLYLAHPAEVEVLDVDTGAVRGRIPNLRDVYGIAIAPHIDRGYVTHSTAGKVTIFDLRTLECRGDVNTGRQPHSIVYDAASGHLFAFNEGSSNVTVIKDGDLIATIALGGRPKHAVADGRGRIFVSLDDRNTVVTLDSQRLTVDQRWPLAACEQPASIALDMRNGRLFVGCGNRKMAVLDSSTGREIASLPAAERVDGTAFDREAGLIFNSGDGTLTVIRQNSADSYTVLETVRTHESSREVALDSRTHRLFAPASFGILVLGRP